MLINIEELRRCASTFSQLTQLSFHKLLGEQQGLRIDIVQVFQCFENIENNKCTTLTNIIQKYFSGQWLALDFFAKYIQSKPAIFLNLYLEMWSILAHAGNISLDVRKALTSLIEVEENFNFVYQKLKSIRQNPVLGNLKVPLERPSSLSLFAPNNNEPLEVKQNKKNAFMHFLNSNVAEIRYLAGLISQTNDPTMTIEGDNLLHLIMQYMLKNAREFEISVGEALILGVDLFQQDAQGRTVMHRLLDSNARTAYHARILEEQQPGLINTQNSQGDTLLHIAACSKYPENIPFILALGAIDTPNKQGKTAAALLKNNPYALKTLEGYRKTPLQRECDTEAGIILSDLSRLQ